MQEQVDILYTIGQVGQDLYTFVPISQAGQELGYTSERVRQMVIEQKLIGIKKYNRWWVARELIRSFGELQRQAPP